MEESIENRCELLFIIDCVDVILRATQDKHYHFTQARTVLERETHQVNFVRLVALTSHQEQHGIFFFL